MRRSRAGTHPTTLPWPSIGPTGDAKRKPPQLTEPWERALRTQHGICPLCREPLLYVDNPPDSCTQWETWYKGIRTALAHKAITEHGRNRTTRRLVHAVCDRRHPDDQSHGTDQ